jgi:hypothetical protein
MHVGCLIHVSGRTMTRLPLHKETAVRGREE